MKFCYSLFTFLFTSCANGNEIYTASTPANSVIKIFLGISLTDSIDFIRWKLQLSNNQYQLHCDYGTGEPNTNGFKNGGKKVELQGQLKKINKYFQLTNADKVLNLVIVNPDLLHIADSNQKLLTGNGGWSYTLNNMSPAGSAYMSVATLQPLVKDSLVFDGRTPCGVPGIKEAGEDCYKLKWRIVLYAPRGKEHGRYKIYGTAWRKKEKPGEYWAIKSTEDGRFFYQLNDINGKGLLYLLKAGENILFFTDANGKLLVGDEDFSYTLNRIL